MTARASSPKPRARLLRRLASASFGDEAGCESEAEMGSFIAFSSRVLGFYNRGFGSVAETLTREATAECPHQLDIENERAGFQLGVGPLSRDQLIFSREYIEIGGECALVALADDLMSLSGRGNRGSRCGELALEGPAAGRGVRHLVEGVRQGRVVSGDRGAVVRVRTSKLALETLGVEDRERNRGSDAAQI